LRGRLAKRKKPQNDRQRRVILEEVRSKNNHPSEDELYEATVFEIIGHNLEFVGFCPECSKKNRQT